MRATNSSDGPVKEDSSGGYKAADTEVVDDATRVYTMGPNGAPADDQVRIGRVHLNRSTTLHSPFFWLFAGAALGAVASWMILREKRRH